MRDIALARLILLFKLITRRFFTVFLVCGILSAYFVNANAVGDAPWIGFGRDDNVFCGVDTKEKVIALTFDDGPHPRYTDMILDILKEYGVRATFFVVGENAVLYPEELKRIAAEGHELGNHTYTHANLKQIDKSSLMRELSETERVIEELTGQRTTVFRPPEGRCNETVVNCANERGYTTVLWTVDPCDWASPPANRVASVIEKNARCGSVILCHDYNSNKRSPTPEALRTVIPLLMERGYSFVTVSELLRSE